MSDVVNFSTAGATANAGSIRLPTVNNETTTASPIRVGASNEERREDRVNLSELARYRLAAQEQRRSEAGVAPSYSGAGAEKGDASGAVKADGATVVTPGDSGGAGNSTGVGAAATDAAGTERADGNVTVTEALSAVEQFFNSLDPNGDGQVSIEEFQGYLDSIDVPTGEEGRHIEALKKEALQLFRVAASIDIEGQDKQSGNVTLAQTEKLFEILNVGANV